LTLCIYEGLEVLELGGFVALPLVRPEVDHVVFGEEGRKGGNKGGVLYFDEEGIEAVVLGFIHVVALTIT
jgi:hypothetical protein